MLHAGAVAHEGRAAPGDDPAPRLEEAEACLMQSLERSRSQGALGWELRTATDSGNAPGWERGSVSLQKRFSNGRMVSLRKASSTVDLKTAERLLEGLS